MSNLRKQPSQKKLSASGKNKANSVSPAEGAPVCSRAAGQPDGGLWPVQGPGHAHRGLLERLREDIGSAMLFSGKQRSGLSQKCIYDSAGRIDARILQGKMNGKKKAAAEGGAHRFSGV